MQNIIAQLGPIADRKAVEHGVEKYKKAVKGKGYTDEQLEHNSQVRAEALKIIQTIKKDSTIPKDGKDDLSRFVYTQLRKAMLKADDERPIKEAQDELKDGLSNLKDSLADKIEEVREKAKDKESEKRLRRKAN